MTITQLAPPAVAPIGWTQLHVLVTKPLIFKTNNVTPHADYLQQSLNDLGFTDYENKPLVVDGRPGGRTFAALAKMQAATGVAEPDHCGPWSWLVLDDAMYSMWTPVAETYSSLCDRCTAIYKGHNRYNGYRVNSRGIMRSVQRGADAGQAANQSWGRNFVAVDRDTSSGSPSEHRHACARDWMTDLDKDGNYREPNELAACDALCDWYVQRAAGWPREEVLVPTRGDGAKGIDDTTVPLTMRRYRYAGPDRLSRMIWNGRIFEWRIVNGEWRRQWWALKPTSDQHRNHVHMEFAPIVGGVLAA